jgi:arylsulfatase A-like enzyme
MRVVVVSARGLRLDALGLYGNLWIDTPALDGLAASGVVFDQHFAGGADAHRTWRTGRHHLPAPDGQPAAADDAPDLLALLRGRGVFTHLLFDDSRPAVPGFEVGPEFRTGWDQVEQVGATGKGGEGSSALERLLEAVGEALGRLAERDDWLLWLDLATPLPPWDVPEEFLAPYFTGEEGEAEEEEAEEGGEEEGEPGEPLTPVREVEPGPIDPTDDRLFLSLQGSYAAAVIYLDAGVGQLLERLAETERGDQVVVVVTADCGFPLGERGTVGAVRAGGHDSLIHVPLIIRLPEGAGAGRRVDALTQAADLAPTLAGLFGATLPSAHGHDLLPLARGEAGRVRDYACAGIRVGGDVGWCLRTAGWAFLLPAQPEEGTPRGPELYVKPDDRWEVNNVVQHHLEWAEQLERTLCDFVAAALRPGPLVPPPLPEVGAPGPGPQTTR